MAQQDDPTVIGEPPSTAPGHTPAPARTFGPPRLVVISGDQVGRKFPVGGEISIGRGSDSTIQIDGDRVSRRHARILTDESGVCILEDLGSTNGTFVDGKAVDRHKLGFGERIQIGETTLLFTHDNPVEAEQAHQQRMELLGRLGAGIAHDFNNLICAALASLDYLQGQPSGQTFSDGEVVQCLDDIGSSLRRAADLTSRLLEGARRRPYELVRIDLSMLCREVAELAYRLMPKTVKIDLSLEPDLFVKADRGELHQCIMNLCVNARDAMPSGGTLGISARALSIPAPGAMALRSGKYAAIVVSDTGTGMDKSTRHLAFQPFFSTKPAGKGTGLGLATVAETIRHHGGQVQIESEVGTGTTVWMFLPRDTTDESRNITIDIPTSLAAETGRLRAHGRKARILLVDDNVEVRNSLGRLLRQQGHDVVGAANGQEAIELYRQERPDLVLLDVDMPLVTGPEAYQQIRAGDPTANVIFMSGQWETVGSLLRGSDSARPPAFLRKPIAAKDLARAVRSALES